MGEYLTIDTAKNLVRRKKAIDYYWKVLSEKIKKKEKMPIEAVEMFNILEGNKHLIKK